VAATPVPRDARSRGAPLRPDEDVRLAALRRLDILDTPPEERFDRVTRLARQMFDVPIVLVSLVDAERQWFKSCIGLPVSETPRGLSFCAYAIHEPGPLVVEDARRDPRFADNALVTGEPYIRFYAGHPLFSPDGFPLGTLCVIDRRPRTLGEADLAALGDLARLVEDELGAVELNRALAAERAATARLETTCEELERVGAIKSEFVSIVSHEFRTALTGIQGFSELLRDEELSGAEVRDFAADIHRNALRLTRLIGDLLDLDRMESGHMRLNREVVVLDEVVRGTVDQLKPLLAEHPTTVRLGADGRTIRADPDKLTQALMNLLSNAVKYSPAGGPIVVATEIRDGAAIVSVADRGVGIPSESLERVFERFCRIESGQTRHIKGTGLGLPIVRQIAELHGGRAWAESRPGEGSTFYVALPLGGGPAEGREV
jgi:signal transduction histidine kinase